MEDEQGKKFEPHAKLTIGAFGSKPGEDVLEKYEQAILDAAKGGKLLWIVENIGEIGCIVYVGDPNGESQMLPPTADNQSENAMFGQAFHRLVTSNKLTSVRGRLFRSHD